MGVFQKFLAITFALIIIAFFLKTPTAYAGTVTNVCGVCNNNGEGGLPACSCSSTCVSSPACQQYCGASDNGGGYCDGPGGWGHGGFTSVYGSKTDPGSGFTSVHCDTGSNCSLLFTASSTFYTVYLDAPTGHVYATTGGKFNPPVWDGGTGWCRIQLDTYDTTIGGSPTDFFVWRDPTKCPPPPVCTVNNNGIPRNLSPNGQTYSAGQPVTLSWTPDSCVSNPTYQIWIWNDSLGSSSYTTTNTSFTYTPALPNASNPAGTYTWNVCQLGANDGANGGNGWSCGIPINASQGYATSSFTVTAAASCNSSNCPSGCCSGTTCLPGNTNAACGTGGNACTGCAANQACVTNSCLNLTCSLTPASQAIPYSTSANLSWTSNTTTCSIAPTPPNTSGNPNGSGNTATLTTVGNNTYNLNCNYSGQGLCTASAVVTVTPPSIFKVFGGNATSKTNITDTWLQAGQYISNN